MQNLKKPLVLLGLAIIVVAMISWFAFPDWHKRPGAVYELLGVVVVAVMAMAKDFVAFLVSLRDLNKPKESESKPTELIQTGSNSIQAKAETIDADQFGGTRNEYGPHMQIGQVGTLVLGQNSPAPAQTTSEAQPEPVEGQLPPGSWVTYPRNKVFTGREKDLEELARLLLAEDGPGRVSVTQLAAASGLGGIGKTQLAVEFCYRHGHQFDGVHWVSAAQKEDIPAGIAICGARMALPGWPDALEAQVALTLREWSRPGRRLVVLDNLEDPALLADWLPRLGNVRVLITTRRPHWPTDLGVQARRLDTFARAESLDLLRKLAPRLEHCADEALDAVAEALGDLPLAIDLAGRYLEECESCAPEEYVAQIEKAGSPFQHLSQAGVDPYSPTGHPSLAKTFALTWERLKGDGEVEKLARLFFRAAGYLAAAQPIPTDIFQGMAPKDAEDGLADHALRRLADLGLLTPGEKGPSLHPLLRAYAHGLVEEGVSAAEALAPALTNAANGAYNSGLPSNYLPYRPHLEAALAGEDAFAPLPAAGLWNALGRVLEGVAEFPAARQSYERALALAEGAGEAGETAVAVYASNLGGVLQDQGDLAGARACCERALAIDEKIYGKEHPEVATDVNNLGLVLRAQGDLVGARACFERALAINEQVYGKEHPEVATDVNNLGTVLRNLGDLAGARACFKRALAIDEQVYGKEHPEVATDANNLGGVLQDQGDLTGARACFERALAIREKFLPAGHPNIQKAQENLEGVRREMEGDNGLSTDYRTD